MCFLLDVPVIGKPALQSSSDLDKLYPAGNAIDGYANSFSQTTGKHMRGL